MQGQNRGLVDSLILTLPTHPDDTNKVLLLRDIAWELNFHFDPEEANTYLERALNLAKKLDYEEGVGDIYYAYGVFANYHGNPNQAVKYFYKAMAIRQNLGNQQGIAAMYNNIGNAKDALGEYPDALDNYYKALRIHEELNDEPRMARLYYNIADLHEKMGNYPEALDNILLYMDFVERQGNEEGMANAYNVIGNIKYELDRFSEAEESYKQSLAIYQSLEDRNNEANLLNNLGNVTDKTSELEVKRGNYVYALRLSREALPYYEQALTIREELADTSGQAEVYNNIGLTYKYIAQYQQQLNRAAEADTAIDKAMEFLERALAIREQIGDTQGIIEVHSGMVEVFLLEDKQEQALEHTQAYLELAKEIKDQKFIQNAYKDLGRIYYRLGEYQLAYKYREQYDELRWDRLDEKRVKDNERKEIVYSDRKKQYEIEAQEQELKVQEAQLKQAKILQYSLFGGTGFLVLLALLLYNRYLIKTKANRKLADANEIIRHEQERSENLLLNILPKETADELKEKGKADAKRYEAVTVLFTDFKSFTSISEQLTPEDLVAELDECFREFDAIMDKYNIEKIKTIGDAYMCAGGLPTPLPDHAER
ncbi:MAG: tetratricopeptide repeat protein, partial [Phaeodactylibacter sp.]|nr:tetratricopeptide repeat protein [Phaeodactylibacter sp.]